jgi:hypothetical protein
LERILQRAQDARDGAFDLFARRVDTRRNVDSFILLRDAFNRLNDACNLLDQAMKKATEAKSSDQNSVADEIMVRSGRMRILDASTPAMQSRAAKAEVLLFPGGDNQDDE